MTLLDPGCSTEPAPTSDVVGEDAGITLDKQGTEVRIVLRGHFDDRSAAHLHDLVDWLADQGPLSVLAAVVDEPLASDGFVFRRLTALARARGSIEARGGTLQVSAARRLRRTLTAMRLPPAPT